MAERTYPGAIYRGRDAYHNPRVESSPDKLHHSVQYVPAALVDTLVEALIASRDNYGKYGDLRNDPNAPGELITKINNALEKAGVTGA